MADEVARLVVSDGEVWLSDGSLVRVTPGEMRVLCWLAWTPGHFRKPRPDDEATKVWVSHLRRKGVPVETRRWHGYRLPGAVVVESGRAIESMNGVMA